METAKRIMVLMILTALATDTVQSAAQSEAKISGTRKASCLVKVTCDPSVLPLSFDTIEYLLYSSTVGGKAVREVLGVSPDNIQDLFMIEYLQELPSYIPSESSREHSSGMEAGMDEYEYAMMMEQEMNAIYGERTSSMTASGGSRSSTGSSRSRRRSRRIPSTGRPVAASGFPLSEQTHLFNLVIELSDEIKPAAEEFMDAVLFYFRNAMVSASNEHMQKLKNQLKLADEEATRAETELDRMQQELRVISGSRILDRDKILGEIEDIRDDIQRLEMEQDSDKIMVDVATKQIAEIQAKMQKEIDADGVSKDLAELLLLQEKNLLNIEKLSENGSATGIDVATAREKLTRARIEWAQRRDQLRKSAGGNQIESLNSKLASYSVKEIQNRARLSNLSQQLTEAEDLLAKADSYEMLSLKIGIAKQNLQETILWRDRISRLIRIIQPPMVSTIGGD